MVILPGTVAALELSASVMTRSPSGLRLAALEATGLSVMIVARPRKAQVYGRRFA
jgi:hypothetical protein